MLCGIRRKSAWFFTTRWHDILFSPELSFERMCPFLCIHTPHTHTHFIHSLRTPVFLTAMKFDLEPSFCKIPAKSNPYSPLFLLHGFCFNDTCLVLVHPVREEKLGLLSVLVYVQFNKRWKKSLLSLTFGKKRDKVLADS